MSSTNWRKYGGTKNLTLDNNITTHTLVTDNLVLRNAYVGAFIINGDLVVTDFVTVGKDVDISGNITAQNASFQSAHIEGDLSLNGNLYVSQNAIIEGAELLYNELYLGSNADSFLYGSQTTQEIGINTTSPQATLDIAGNQTEVLNVYSNQPTNRNIIARNQNNHGIVVQTTDTSSAIQFYNDNTISSTSSTPDAQIEYIEGGYLQFQANANTQFYSPVSISPITGQNTHIDNETTIIYDISNGNYLPRIYANPSENTGNALSLITTDTSSVTFLNIITPLKKGLNVGGGVYPNDQSRSLATLGYTDNSGNYVPAQNIVSGASTVKYRSTTGINTFAPRVDNYVLDINGPVHLTNGQITPVIDISFQIYQTGFSATTGISVGSPSAITSLFYQNILYTSTGGTSWQKANINSGNLQSTANYFNTIYTYNATYAFLAGTEGFLFYTNNGGANWARLIPSGESNNITSLYAVANGINNVRIFYTKAVINPTNRITYFDISLSALNGSTINAGTPTQVTDANFTACTHINGIPNTTTVFVTGTSSGTDKVATYSTLSLSSATYSSTASLYNFNALSTFTSTAIAVGTGAIYTTTNNGSSWTLNTSATSQQLNAVYIYNASIAVAVGNSGTLIYSSDGFATWQVIPQDILNASGNANNITSYNLVSVTMTDINTLIISAILTPYQLASQYGQSRQFYLYLPNLFNRANNSVLDISGAINISGDIHINDNGNLYTSSIEPTGNTITIGQTSNNIINTVNIGNVNNSTVTNYDIINIGGTYDQVNIRGNVTTTTVNNLDIKNLNISVNAGNTANSTSAGAGLLITDNDISGAGEIIVDKALNGYLFKAPNKYLPVSSNGSINNVVDFNINSLVNYPNINSGILMLQAGGATLTTDSSFVVTVGNIDISNIFVKDYGNSTSTNQQIATNVTISSTQDSTSTFTGALAITGGVGIGANITVGGNATINQNSIFLGNVAIGIPSPTYSYKLDISGIVRAVVYDATSDYRVKANVRTLSSEFSVDSLKPIHYFNLRSKKEEIGFLAHEVQEVYPYLVSGHKDGEEHQSLNYNGIIGIIVHDLKETKRKHAEENAKLMDIISELKQEIAVLQEKSI